MDLWVLAGQSNMEGIGALDDAAVVDPRTAVLSMAGEWTDAAEPLHRLWESDTPVHRDLLRSRLPVEDRELTDAELAARAATRRTGAGLGPAFASRLADLTGAGVGLIPTAHGGTSLEQWGRGAGGAAPRSTGTLYGSMLDRIRRALERPGTRLGGVLWYQGESDATAVRSPRYGDGLAAWIADLRADVGRPDLPVLVVQLGRYSIPTPGPEMDERSWDRVREAQRTLPSLVPGTATVAALDLALADPIHVATRGLRRLGRRLAEVAAAGEPAPDPVSVEPVGADAHGLLRVRLRCRGVSGGWSAGGWGAAERLPGFELVDADGVPLPRLRVVDAHADADVDGAIVVVTSAASPAELDGVHLAYGRGFDPVCLAVDGRDLPLPAFRALPIG